MPRLTPVRRHWPLAAGALFFLTAVSWAFFGSDQSHNQSRVGRNILLIVIDTLGAPYLGAYGGEPGLTPNLDRLADRATVFERVYSTAPWTKPAVASLFTGQYPSVHGVRLMQSKMEPRVETLAELLGTHGFHTGGIVSHKLISPRTGYARGFHHYEIVPLRSEVHDSVTSDLVTDRAIGWIREHQTRNSDKPFFLFVHYFDPHYNYQHHEQFERSGGYKGRLTPGTSLPDLREQVATLTSEDVDYLNALYREEIAYTDSEIGRLFRVLKSESLIDDTTVIFTADHGEEFLEHGGLGHGRTLYDELIRVPLIVATGGRERARRIRTPVSLVDILPTITELYKMTVRDTLRQGVSLVPLMNGDESGFVNRTIFAEVDFRPTTLRAFKLAAMKGSYKFIFDKITAHGEGFNLKRDPLEQSPRRVFGHRPILRELQRAVAEFAREVQKEDIAINSTAPDVPDGATTEELRELESLGYL